MNSRLLTVLLASAIGVGASIDAAAQSTWVDFNDERGRMAFATNDPHEKDIVAGDVDNDGDTDVVIVRKIAFSVPGPLPNLLLINENGVLVDRTVDFIPTFITDAGDDRDVQLFDSNNDGWLDIVTVTTFGSVPKLYINRGNDAKGNWLGYEDQGDNWFSPPFPVSPKFCGVGIGDVNMDGFNDLYFVDYDNNLECRLLMNNGDDTYTDETSTRLSPAASIIGFGTSAFIADFNNDGFNDIVSLESTVTSGAVGIEFCINDGTGHFNQTQGLESIATYMLEQLDFNNDGRIDIYVISDFQDYLLINDSTNPDGTVNMTRRFVSQSILTQGFNGNLHPADVDRDGMVDMAVCDVDVDIPGCERRFCLLRNNGVTMVDPNNAINPISWNQQGSHDMCWIDINRDGYLDIFMATCDDYHMYVNDQPFVPGDINLDGVANLLDVQPFVQLLSTGGYQLQADFNGDNVLNLLDISGFIDVISGN